MELYLNNSSIKNNKYFKTHKELLNISIEELEEIKAYKKRTGFLKNDNSKLGKDIYAFDLPAVVSCPNSNECFKDCYANKGSYLYGGTGAKTSNTYNFAIALNDIKYLEKELIKEIEERNNNKRKKNINNIRIHSSGDFFSKEYFVMWCNIAKRFKNLNIFTYSKAPQIEGLKVPKNLNIIDSFITIDNTKYLNYAPIEQIKKMRAKTKGIICPVTIGKKIDCSACKYCITKNKVLFVAH
tara:strand:+ start:253 stop:972 length:720 start_codon:yes stop_codon:yes gene_type:complete